MAWRSKRASLLLVASVWMVMWQPGIILGGYLRSVSQETDHERKANSRIIIDLNLREESELVWGKTKAHITVSVSRRTWNTLPLLDSRQDHIDELCQKVLGIFP